jgi:hypothetical protein
LSREGGYIPNRNRSTDIEPLRGSGVWKSQPGYNCIAPMGPGTMYTGDWVTW